MFNYLVVKAEWVESTGKLLQKQALVHPLNNAANESQNTLASSVKAD